jgi:mRNA interferase MazF
MVAGDRLIKQGDVYWAELPIPRGSEPGYDRPVLVIQQTSINASELKTVLCVPLTTNTRLAAAPGNVLLSARQTGLPKVSVANVSQVITLDKQFLHTYVTTLPDSQLNTVLDGIEFMLGRGYRP